MAVSGDRGADGHTPLKVSDMRQYWRELTSGNYRLHRFLPRLLRGFVIELAARTRLIGPVPLTGDGTNQTPSEPLDLQPGDVVRVRSPEEIARTLDGDGLNRGLSFDREMLPFCGRTCVVKDRVSRIIDDRTGRMLQISADAIILEGAVCSGERSVGRWFCPREIYPFWREAWLVRARTSRHDVRRAPTSGLRYKRWTGARTTRRRHRVGQQRALAPALSSHAV